MGLKGMGFKGISLRGRGKKYRKKETTGIISEGISRALYGKATLGKGKQFREIVSGTVELEKAGLTVGEFITRGGFVTQPAKFKRRL